MQTATLLFLCLDSLFSCVIWGAMNFGGAIVFIGSWQTVKLLGLSLPGFGPREANFCAGLLDIMVGVILMATVVVPDLPKCERWRYALVVGIPNVVATPLGISALMSMSGGPAEERRFSEWLGVVFLIFGMSQLTAESWRSCVVPRTAGNVKETQSAEHYVAIQDNVRDVERDPDAKAAEHPLHWLELDNSHQEHSAGKQNQSEWSRVELWVVHHEFSSDWFFLVASGLCAFAMGFLGASIGTGGPPMLILFNLAQVQPSEQRVTFVPAAFAGCLLRLVLLLTANDSQLISLFWVEWKLLPALVVFAVVGGWAGTRLYGRMDRHSFTQGLLWVVLTAGLVMTRALQSESYAEAGLLSSTLGSAAMFVFLLWAELSLLCAIANWIKSRRAAAEAVVADDMSER